MVGIEEETIFNLADELLTNQDVHNLMAKASNPYGDGHASKRIVDAILYHFGYLDEKPINFGEKMNAVLI